MTKVENNGGTLTMTNKGLLYLNKESNVDDVYDIVGATSVVLSDTVNNTYFTIDNTNDFSLFIQYATKTVEVPSGLIEPMALDSNVVTITASQPFDVILFNVSDSTTYDVLSSLGTRVSEMTIVQGDNTILPNSASIVDNADSFIGSFNSRVVTLEVFDEYMGEFDKNLPFDVYHEFMVITESEFFDLKESTNKVKLGTFMYDKEDSKFDDLSKKHTIVGYEDIKAYNSAIKVDIPQGLTGEQLMSFITNKVGKLEPVYKCDMPLGSYVFNKINHNADELTKLSYWIKMYAELNLCNAYVIDDRLTFVSLIDDNPEFTIRQVDYSDPFELGDVELINSLVFEGEEAVEDPIVVGDTSSIATYGEQDLRIVGNQLINALEREDIRTILDGLLPKFFVNSASGYFYRPFKSNEVYINPKMGFTNSINIEDRDFNVWRSHITQLEWTYTPSVRGKIEGVKAPATQESDNISKDVIDQLNMGIKVDRVDGRITAEVTNIETSIETLGETVNTNSASITVNENAIANEVLAREELDGVLRTEISSQVQQTASSFDIIFNKLENDQNLDHEEIELIQSYFRINEDGVIIGKSGSQIEFFAENERVGFRDKQLGDIAYWEGGTMHVDKLIAVVTIMVGFHVIERYVSTVAGNTTVVRMGVN